MNYYQLWLEIRDQERFGLSFASLNFQDLDNTLNIISDFNVDKGDLSSLVKTIKFKLEAINRWLNYFFDKLPKLGLSENYRRELSQILSEIRTEINHALLYLEKYEKNPWFPYLYETSSYLKKICNLPMEIPDEDQQFIATLPPETSLLARVRNQKFKNDRAIEANRLLTRQIKTRLNKIKTFSCHIIGYIKWTYDRLGE